MTAEHGFPPLWLPLPMRSAGLSESWKKLIGVTLSSLRSSRADRSARVTSLPPRHSLPQRLQYGVEFKQIPMSSEAHSRKFSTRTHKGRACFSIPVRVQSDLNLRRFGNRVRLIVDSSTGHFEGTKKLMSGPEIYGRDINESGIKKDQPITVIASCPDRFGDAKPRRNRTPNYWALMANPKRYDIERAVAELDEDDWTVHDSDVKAGDRVAIWKAKGQTPHRGIVALGEVLSDPASRIPLSTNRKYSLDPKLSERAETRVTRLVHSVQRALKLIRTRHP